MTKEDRPLSKIGVQKHVSAQMWAQRLVTFVWELEENLMREEAFLWAVIRLRIWGNISVDSLMTPTCSAWSESGILELDKDTGFRKDSIGGIFLSLLLTKAISLVLSGTKIVFDQLAYWSLREANRFKENKSFENRAVSSAWPIAEIINLGTWLGVGWLG